MDKKQLKKELQLIRSTINSTTGLEDEDEALLQYVYEAVNKLIESLADQQENQVDDINVVDIRAQQQAPVQTTPNSEQLKQILDSLDRCIHMDSKKEFLRTWIRDWTEHKLAKHKLSTRHQGETK